MDKEQQAASAPSSPHVRADLVAGLTTAVMLIPQSMAYAMLAGLPPIVGLYAAGVPLLAYALLGTSRELAVGPVAMDSLLTAATVGVIAQSGTDNYIELAALLALMVGLIQLATGLVRGGFLANFLSRPVVSGFTSAAALIIASSQVSLLFGISLPRSSSVFDTVYALAGRVQDIHLATLGLALASVLGLLAMKRWVPKWPRALIVVVVGALLAGPIGLAALGVDVVGAVPSGLPSLRVPAFDENQIRALGPGAVTIALVAFMEAISVGTKMADRSGARLNANRELLALGLANLAAGLFRGYPVAGGFSRTAVNADAGAKTKWAGVVTALAVLLTLYAFTAALFYVPKAALGAIIVTAVFGLFDAAEARRLWALKRNDFYLLAGTFVATLTLGIQTGIAVGVGASLLLLVVRTTRPHTAVLGRLPGTAVYRNVKRFDEAVTFAGVLIVRLDAQLYFGNVNFLRDSLEELESQAKSPLHLVVLDASGINQLDSSAERALSELHERYEAQGIRLVLASVKGPVRDVLERSGLMARLGDRGMVYRVHDALTETLAA